MGLALPPPTNAFEESAQSLVKRFEEFDVLNRATIPSRFLLFLLDNIAAQRTTCEQASAAYIIAAKAGGEHVLGRIFFALSILHHHQPETITPAFRRWLPQLITGAQSLHTECMKDTPPNREYLDALLRNTVPPNNDDPSNAFRLTLQDYAGIRAGYARLLLIHAL